MSLIYKYRLLTLLLLTIASSSAAQAQDWQIEIGTEEVESPKKERYHYLNIDDYEQRTIYKVYSNFFLSSDRKPHVLNFINRVAVEHKLSPAVSLEIGGMIYPNHGDELLIYPNHTVNGELRYYLNKHSRSRAVKDRINNFSGNYVSFEFDRTQTNDHRVLGGRLVLTQYSLKFARQQKLGKWGFYDYGVALDYSRWANNSSSIGLSVRLEDGLAFGKSKTTTIPGNPEELSDKTEDIWRGGFIGLGNVRITMDNYQTFYSVSPYAEFNLGNYFTLRASMFFSHSRQNLDVSDRRYRGYESSLSFSVRRYLGVKAKAQEGRVLPRFNGTYISLGMSQLVSYSAQTGPFTDSPELGYDLNPSVGFGWQRNAGKRLLVSFGGGIGYSNFRDEFWMSAGVGVGFVLSRF